ncbi:MAG: UDP-N-acetylmuramate dehydrogenase, partial [Polyangiales bacterium]
MWRTAPVLLRPHVPLAPRTTLGLGGTARWYGHAQTRAALLSALHWADRHAVPVAVLGGGSNVVVADDGFDGLVLAVGTRGRALSWVSAPPAVLDLASLADSAADLAALQRRRWAQLQLEAGESWDAVVRWSVQLGLGALAPLSGIPGLVGAAPVQNIGAYGRELAHVACALDVYDRSLARLERWPAQRAAFAYRHSLFKTEPGRWLVLGLTVALPQGAALPLRYAELQRHLGARQPEPYTPAQVRAAVLTLRRRKSMCLDPGCPNHRSVGSFFTNPVISGAAFQVLTAHLAAASGASCELPHWPQPDG